MPAIARPMRTVFVSMAVMTSCGPSTSPPSECGGVEKTIALVSLATTDDSEIGCALIEWGADDGNESLSLSCGPECEGPVAFEECENVEISARAGVDAGIQIVAKVEGYQDAVEQVSVEAEGCEFTPIDVVMALEPSVPVCGDMEKLATIVSLSTNDGSEIGCATVEGEFDGGGAVPSFECGPECGDSARFDECEGMGIFGGTPGVEAQLEIRVMSSGYQNVVEQVIIEPDGCDFIVENVDILMEAE